MHTLSLSIIAALALGVPPPGSVDNSYEYNAFGQRYSITDGAGNKEQVELDTSGRPTIHYDQLNKRTYYTYTTGSQPTRVQTPNGAVTQYQLYGVEQIAQETSPDRGTTNYTYDSAGNLTSYTDARGVKVETDYDALNRSVEKRVLLNDGTVDATYNYTWDQPPYGIGELSSVQLNRGTTTQTNSFNYNQAGQISKRVQTRNNVALQTSFTYTDTGKLATLTYPSGNQLAYQYNDFDKLVAITWNNQPIVNSIAYIPFGSITEFVLGNAIVHQRPFDKAGRMTGYSLANELYQIEYNLAGHIERISSNANNAQLFQYDAAGRLTHYENNTSQGTYTYDDNTNRITATGIVSQNLAYQRQSNKLASINGQAVAHDAAGNLTQDHRQFSYDGMGRLVQVQNGTNQASYEYNAFGERSYKNDGTQERLFFYDDEGHLLGEYNASGQPLAEYIWLGDLPVAVQQYINGTAATYYIEADHLGTPRVITDTNQQVRWRWDSTPFGETLPNENPANLGAFVFNLRFPGQYYDTESGLHYNYFRDYNPAIGRYIESDPIGLEAGINTYGYVSQNPISYMDKEGLKIKGPVPRTKVCVAWKCTVCEEPKTCGDPRILGEFKERCKVYYLRAPLVNIATGEYRTGHSLGNVKKEKNCECVHWADFPL